MAVDVTKIRAYQSGLVACSGYGVSSPTLPTNATSSLNPAIYSEVGALTDAGVTDSMSQDFNNIYMWQGNTLAATLLGKNSQTFKFAAMETNLTTVGLAFPGSTLTQVTGGMTIAQKPPVQDIRAWVIHGISGASLQRVVVPLGQITSRGDVVWSAENVTVREWTVTCYVDALGNIAYRYLVDAALGL